MKVLMTKVVPVVGFLVQLLFIVDVLIELYYKLYTKFKPKMNKATTSESSTENKDEL